jgi:hypothetical protein
VVCPIVPIGTPPIPLPLASMPLPDLKGGGIHTCLLMRGWGPQFGRLEKKPSTLSTLCLYYNLINLLMNLFFSRSSSDTERGTSKTSRSLYRELASVRRRIEDMEQQFVLRTGYRPSQVAGHHTSQASQVAGHHTSRASQIAGHHTSTRNRPSLVAGHQTSTRNRPLTGSRHHTSTRNRTSQVAGHHSSQASLVTGHYTATANRPYTGRLHR